jgi:hypothetical protein
MRHAPRRSLLLAPFLVIVAVGGCASRAHLTPTQGQSYNAVFERQAPPVARIAGPVKGLDSQDAAIISSTYRRGLAPRNAQVKEEPMLLVAPPVQQRGAMPLAPSVPRE